MFGFSRLNSGFLRGKFWHKRLKFVTKDLSLFWLVQTDLNLDFKFDFVYILLSWEFGLAYKLGFKFGLAYLLGFKFGLA